MSEKPGEENKLIGKMRKNTERQSRRTGTRPYRRTRMKVLKNRPKDSPQNSSTIEAT